MKPFYVFVACAMLSLLITVIPVGILLSKDKASRAKCSEKQGLWFSWDRKCIVGTNLREVKI